MEADKEHPSEPRPIREDLDFDE
jgi:hypothetical protein